MDNLWLNYCRSLNLHCMWACFGWFIEINRSSIRIPWVDDSNGTCYCLRKLKSLGCFWLVLATAGPFWLVYLQWLTPWHADNTPVAPHSQQYAMHCFNIHTTC